MLHTLEQHTSVPQTDVGSEAFLMNLLAILAFVLAVPPLFLLCIRFRRRQPANQVGAEQHGIDNPGRADDDIEIIPAPNIQQEQARAETVVPIEEGENPCVGNIESTSFTTDGNCKDEHFKDSKANVTVSKRTSFDKDTLQCVINNGGLNRRLHEIEPDIKDERIGETLSNRTLTSYPVYENIGEVFDSTRAFQFEAGKCSAEETCSTTCTDTNPVYQYVNYFMNEQQEQEVMAPEQIVTSCPEASAEHYTMSDVNLSDQDSLSSDVDIYTDDTSGYGLSASTDPPALTPEECSKTATYHESCSSFTEAHQLFPEEGELKYLSSGNFDNQGIQSCYLKGHTPGANASDQGSFSSGVHMYTDDTVSRGSSSDQTLYLPSSQMFSNTATNPETCPGCTLHDRDPHEVHQRFTEGGDLANGSGGTSLPRIYRRVI